MSQRASAPTWIWVVILTAMTAACASPPTEVIEAARDRLASIPEEDATYAADQYAAAQDLAAQLQAELTAQDDSFAMTRSYERAEELATELEASAAEVQRTIESEKTRLASEAERLLADTQQALTASRAAFPDLPEETATELEDDAATVDSSLGDVTQALDEGRLADAQRFAESALSAARRVSTAVEEEQTAQRVAEEELAARVSRGAVILPRAVVLDGERLGAGEYQVRLTDEGATPVEGEGPERTRWVELRQGDAVVGRALAWVVPDAEIVEITEPNDWRPRNETRVNELVEGDYVRLWINREGSSYLVHLPTASR